ncbi:MAG: hypothetical protein AB7D05_07270 [Mangrovibacterium sp.]
MRRICFGMLVPILLFSCKPRENEKIPLAQVGERFLYLKDVLQVFPEKLSEQDSALWMDDFVRKWVRSELVILNAEKNLPAEMKNVEAEMEAYRKSLLTFRYKNELMLRKMDTLVSREQIRAYYDKHKQEYLLKGHLVKAVYMKVPLEVANPETIKNLGTEEDQQKLSLLDEYGVQYAKAYDRFNDQWVKLDEVLNQLPEKINGDEHFLRRNRLIESSDTDFYYFICIRDFRIRGQAAPPEYVESIIRDILLNKRKIQFLKEIEEDIYREGLASGKFKIFNIQK